MAKIHYTDMLLPEFRAAMERMPVAYVPIGLLEWHADHLPLGTDVIRAQWVADGVAQAIGGIVLPPLYTSCPGYSSFEGTLVFEHETAVTVAVELAQQLEKVGFQAALFLSAHGGAAQEAFLAEIPARYTGRMPVLALQVSKASGRGDHAGLSETSDIMAAAPELVRLDLFQYPENPINRYPVAPEKLWPAETRPWVWRKDFRSEVSADIGRDSLQKIVEFCRTWLAEQGIPRHNNR